MTQNVSMSPVYSATQLFNNGGAPLNGGYIHTYIAGTLNNATTYSDNLGTVPNANPIVLDSSGRSPEIWLVNGVSYDLVLTSGTVVLQTASNVVGIDQLSTSVYTPPVTTNGDIFIYNNGPTRLPIGTTGQVLTVSGGEPTWATSSSGLPIGPITKPLSSQFPTLVNLGSFTAPSITDSSTGIYIQSNIPLSTSTPQYQAIVQPIGSATTLTALCSSQGTFNTTPGVILYESATNKAVTFTYFGSISSSGQFIICYWNGTTRTGYTFVNIYKSPEYLWHQVQLRSGNLIWAGSPDGVNWMPISQGSISAYFTTGPDNWGFVVGSAGSGTVNFDAMTVMSATAV